MLRVLPRRIAGRAGYRSELHVVLVVVAVVQRRFTVQVARSPVETVRDT